MPNSNSKQLFRVELEANDPETAISAATREMVRLQVEAGALGQLAGMFTTEAVLDEVRVERQRQDAKWGGAEYDDAHDLVHFTHEIERRCEEIVDYPRITDREVRHELRAIAALAVAAIESLDRKSK